MSEEQKISQRYRELPREEPPRALDDAILAASRRAVEARPAPLVVPTGRRRWYFPLAAAAVIVLAVAVTVHVERQQEKLELAEAPASVPPAREEQAAAAQAPAEPPRAFTPDPKPTPAPKQAPPAAADSRELRAQRDAEPLADLQKSQQAPSSPAPPPAASAPAPAQDAVSGTRESARADAGAKPFAEMQQAPARARISREAEVASTLPGFARASPEQWLQGIADLRRQGRHEEADKALAEFRRTYPDYRISEAMLEKVEKR
jgi:hypothetical protein